VNGTATATVTPAPAVLTTITVSPATISVVAGNTAPFTATKLDQYGEPFTATVTWSSSNPTVGTIDATTGVFTANAIAGTSTIIATNGTIKGTATVYVRVLTKITVSPSAAKVYVNTTANFTALAKGQYGMKLNASIIWTSSNPKVGTINATGAFNATGVFTANATNEGTTIITATSGNIKNTTTVTVSKAPAVLTSITVTPQPATINVNGTIKFNASPKDQYGANVTNVTVTWNSSNPSVGKINPTTGVFTASATAGTAIITITANNNGTIVKGTAKVSVTKDATIATANTTTTNIGTTIVNIATNGTITGSNTLNEMNSISLGNNTLHITIAVNKTDDNKGTVTKMVLETPSVEMNETSNTSANINLNLNSSVWTGGNVTLTLQPVNNLDDTINDSDAMDTATAYMDAVFLELDVTGTEPHMIIQAKLSGEIDESGVNSLPITMVVDAKWYEEEAKSNRSNVYLFKFNDTTGELKQKQIPTNIPYKDNATNTYTLTFEMDGFSTFALIATTPITTTSSGDNNNNNNNGGGGGGNGLSVVSSTNVTQTTPVDTTPGKPTIGEPATEKPTIGEPATEEPTKEEPEAKKGLFGLPGFGLLMAIGALSIVARRINKRN